MGVMEISEESWRYMVGVLGIFDRCPGDICSDSWKYLMGVLKICGRCPGDI